MKTQGVVYSVVRYIPVILLLALGAGAFYFSQNIDPMLLNAQGAFDSAIYFIVTHHPIIAAISSFFLIYLIVVFWPRDKRELDKLRQQLVAHTSHTPLAICAWTRDNRVIDWNETAEALFGYTKKEALGRRLDELIVPQEAEHSCQSFFDQLAQSRIGAKSTNQNVTKDGRKIICDWYSYPLRNARGEVVAVSSMALDVSDRLRIAHEEQTALRKSREEQAAIVHMATHRFIVEGRVGEALPIVTETAARVLSVARYSVWLFSADRQEISCADIFEASSASHSKGAILRAADYPRYFSALTHGRAIDAENAFTDPRTSELAEGYLKNLGIVSMLDAAVRVGGQVVGVVCAEHCGDERRWTPGEIAFAADVADQIAQVLVVHDRAEVVAKLRQSEEIFRQLTENISGIFWLTSVDKKTVYYISPSFEKVWGRGMQLYYSDPNEWFETIHPDDKERVRDAMPLQCLAKYDLEFRILRPDGEIRWVRDRAFPIKNEEGDIYRLAGIAEDITEQKKTLETQEDMERQLRQTQKMEALGSLAGGIAHDFNNILASIIGYSQLLREELVSEPSKYSMIDAVLVGANRAKNLVKQILAFTRQTEGKSEIFQFSELIEDACKLIKVSMPKNISLKTILDPDCFVKADPNQLYQVVMNLCTNAIYAMRDRGGELRVELSMDRSDTMLPGAVVLKVRDAGDGIPRDIRDRIFDPFFTTKPVGQGTGLGLSVVHGVVRGLGGTIEVESEDGRGAEFILKLPIGVLATVSDIYSEPIELKKGNGRILFVDDEEMVCELFGEVLTRNGYEVLLAHDATSALKILDSNTPIDLLITDLTMPGLSGAELIRQTAKLRPTLKTILCSGYDPGSIAPDLKNLVFARLTKPFAIQELLMTVKNAFGNETQANKVPKLRVVGT